MFVIVLPDARIGGMEGILILFRKLFKIRIGQRHQLRPDKFERY